MVRASKLWKGCALALLCHFGPLHAQNISNTASLTYLDPDLNSQNLTSNTVQATYIPPPTPAEIRLLGLVPSGGTETLWVDGTLFWDTAAYLDIPPPVDANGDPIDVMSGPLVLGPVTAMRSNDPVILVLEDSNRNLNSLAREFVVVNITTTVGDSERLQLQETANNSGVFAGIINTEKTSVSLSESKSLVKLTDLTLFNGILSVAAGARIHVSYQDSFFGTDQKLATLRFDPYPLIFDSSTGALIDGVTVSLVHAATELPATVFDDDGVTPYPSTVVSGGSVTAGANTYSMPDGAYRFPVVPPGNYKIKLSNVPAGYKWPTTVPLSTLQTLRDPSNDFFVLDSGYEGSQFTLNSGDLINVDVPVDPLTSDLILEKSVSKTEASVGDFLRYEILVRYAGAASADDVVLRDKLPLGFRYRKGSLRVDDAPAADPDISGDGRILSLNLGDLAVSGSRRVSYVTEVSAGARDGNAVNIAVATRSNGVDSNSAQATVKVRPAFFASHAVLMGRVMSVPSCEFDPTVDSSKMKGIGKVRIMMEDGTYVSTDDEGRYHFEKVEPGTHVVQVDENTLPKNLELVSCDKNTRFAGRSHSQFVDVQGGTLWRTDFYVREKQAPKGALSLNFKGEIKAPDEESAAEATYVVELEAKDDLENVKVELSLPRDFAYLPMTGLWKGIVTDGQNENGKLVFRIPKLTNGERGTLSFRAIPQGDVLLVPDHCLKDEHLAKVDLSFRVVGFELYSTLQSQSATCTRSEVNLVEGALPAEVVRKPAQDFIVLDDVTASGGNRKWVEGEAPGISMLFPEEGHNPRSPGIRVVIKHGPGQEIDLRVNREPVSRLNFNMLYSNPAKTVFVSEWKGVPIKEGPNVIEAVIKDEDGTLVQLLKRDIHFANTPAQIVFLPEKSKLVANGVDRPRIAIRVLDKWGKPVRKGVNGNFELNSPYVPAYFEDMSQRRQLSALDRFESEYLVYTDDGIAFIDLAATSEAGEVKVKFFMGEQKTTELNTWLEPEVKDWVVVGFAEGTAAYKTLSGNMEDLPEADKNKELNTDGEAKLYAKGRVKGEWIMTVAYDSGKKKVDKENRFKNVIDPGEFYTLYADSTTQKNDAPTSEKLYLKLEKSRFYALFGDYDSDLSQTELARYNRSFTGVKSEFSGRFLGFKIFGAQQDGHYYKEEIQGRGESTLRLARGGILVGSEKIRKVIRDRERSDKIIEEKTLMRHLDYTIDYRSGLVTFKYRIDSFQDFNPQFIVAEYETLGAATEDFTYGGRVEGKLLNERLKVGVTHIHEEEELKRSELQGADVKIKLAQEAELTLEAAQSNSKLPSDDYDGQAYRAEFDRKGKDFDLNAYAKKTEENFGLGQEAASEAGSFKTGAKAAVHLNDKWDVNAAHDHQRQLASEARQDVSKGDVKYKHTSGSLALGLQRVDERRGDSSIDAHQGTLGVTQQFLGSRLELQGNAEQNLGGEQSVDYPNRYLAQAKYKLTDKTSVFVAQEYTDGELYDSSTTRAGFESNPWTGAKLGSTLNQSISEAGPRTYSTMGLAQSYILNERWTLDAGVDATYTFRESGPASPINPAHPLQSGGFLGNGGYIEDYVVTSAGFTYRAKPWSWNFRAERRDGEVEDKLGAVTNILRELDKDIVLGTSHSYYRSEFEGGTNGYLISGDFSLAYRPLDSRWSILERVKYRYEAVDNAASLPIFGQTTLKGIDAATSSAIVNNFNLNRLSKLRKNQFSLFYGAKVVWDRYDGKRYQSFVDLYGLEVRQDLTEKWDFGVQSSVLNSWTAKNVKYSFGPSLGWSPLTNSWLSLGYNFRGFKDRDFDAARYTSQGLYLKMRIKFDEKTLGLSKDAKRPSTNEGRGN